MGDLALEPQLSGTVKLYDIDYAAAQHNAAIGNRLTSREEVPGKWTYEAVETCEEALTGADVVVLSILPGTFQHMAVDVHLPEEYGIYQPVGDTTGPGGIFRALRTIPVYRELAETIQAHAPHAWVLNYTNPMTWCVRAMTKAFPAINIVGCCHGVQESFELLGAMLADAGTADVDISKIRANILGVNHFTWISQATYEDVDLFPLYRGFANRYAEQGYRTDGATDEDKDNPFVSANRVQFDLFRRFGVIPACGDRHIVEFLPRTWYLRDPQTVRRWKFALTTVDLRMKRQQQLREKSERLRSGREEVAMERSGEQIVAMIKALAGLEAIVTNVNVPNRGQMEGVPYGAVVETNALISRDSVRPVMSGRLPDDLHEHVLKHVLKHESVLQAAWTQDRRLALNAFLHDPLVLLEPDEGERLFDRMSQLNGVVW